MKTQTEKSPYFHRAGTARGVVTLLITGIAVVLFSAAGIARMMGWAPKSTGDSGDALAIHQTAPVTATSEARARPKCPECGVIVSVRENEMTVRMADGSSRLIEETNPAQWRTEERLIVIGGVQPPIR